MVTINYILKNISSDLFISYNSTEREYIDEKIYNFQKSLDDYFGDKILEVILFGSYVRGTILPRRFDESSDVDILIIFNQARRGFTPETYRNQLIDFLKSKYPRTPVLKDHPSVMLELNKIKFDLVPCRIYNGFFSNYYQIPGKTKEWIDTYPKEFNEKLTLSNTKYNSIVKPIIRLFKRWNAYNKYPFTSYDLEQIIADMNFSNDNYETGFFYVIDKFSTKKLTEFSKKRVEILKNNKNLLEKYLDEDNLEKAKAVLCRILGITLINKL